MDMDMNRTDEEEQIIQAVIQVILPVPLMTHNQPGPVRNDLFPVGIVIQP